jgi:hypothetical protein
METTNFGQWADSSTFTYSASTLAGMIRVPGRPQDASASTPDRLIDGGRSVIVYFTLDLPGTAIPENMLNSLGVLDREGKHHDLAVAPLVVLQQEPIVGADCPGPENALSMVDGWLAAYQINGMSDRCQKTLEATGATLDDVVSPSPETPTWQVGIGIGISYRRARPFK